MITAVCEFVLRRTDYIAVVKQTIGNSDMSIVEGADTESYLT